MGAGEIGGGSEGVQADASAGVAVEPEAGTCLGFDVKDGRPESGCRKDVLEPHTSHNAAGK